MKRFGEMCSWTRENKAFLILLNLAVMSRLPRIRGRWRWAKALVLIMTPVLWGGGCAIAAAAPSPSSVLERVKAAGVVNCGVDATPGFSRIDTLGKPTGFDVDFCRAIAAAVVGNSDAIITRRISTASKFEALARGDIDVAFGMTTWTLTRDSSLGVVFPTVIFHDGQGFMVWKDAAVGKIENLGKQTICVQRGTTSAGNLRDMVARRRIDAIILELPTTEEKLNAFAQRRCLVVTGDRSELAAHAATLEPGKGEWIILNETISAEPLSPAVAAGDWQWFLIVRWVVNATLVAEEQGVSQSTLSQISQSATGERGRLLGNDPSFGLSLGLDPMWARRVIEQVGNYEEIFTRNLAPLGLSRGANALISQGGALAPLPMR